MSSGAFSAEELILKPGTPYQIRSADGRWVQAAGVMQPLKLVKSPSRITVWQAVEVGMVGRIALRSPSGWYASAAADWPDGPIVEDPDNATQWNRQCVTNSLYTLSNRTEQFWSHRRESDEIMLNLKRENTENQGWLFIEVARVTDEE